MHGRICFWYLHCVPTRYSRDGRHTFGSNTAFPLERGLFVEEERSEVLTVRNISKVGRTAFIYISFSNDEELFRSKQQKKLFWSKEEQKIKLMFPLLSGEREKENKFNFCAF